MDVSFRFLPHNLYFKPSASSLVQPGLEALDMFKNDREWAFGSEERKKSSSQEAGILT